MEKVKLAKSILIDIMRNSHFLKTDIELLENCINQVCSFKDNQIVSVYHDLHNRIVIDQDGIMYLLTLNHIDYIYHHEDINRELII